MSRKLLVWSGVLALALALPMTQAHAASWSFTVGGGAAVPMGDFADENKVNAQTGFQIGGAVDYRFNEMFAVGVDGSWNRNSNAGEGETSGTSTLDESKFTTWQAGAHGQYFIPAGGGVVSPYLLAGLGVYNTTEKWSRSDTVLGPSSGEDSTDPRIGFKGGLGGIFKVNEMLGIGVEANYNFISQDKAKVTVDNLQYVGLAAGLTFSMMPK